MSKYLSLDTNIILLDANNIYTLGRDKTIVLSDTVLAEVDGKKTIMGDLGYNAREFGRMLGKAELLGMEQKEKFHLTLLLLDEVKIVLLANIDYGTTEKNDEKIIQATKLFESTVGEAVEFMSNDMLCRLQAMIQGLTTSEFKVVEDDGFEFVKELTIEDPEVFRAMHYRAIDEVDEDTKPENFSYRFICATTNQVKLGMIQNGVINIIGKDSEKELRRQSVNPCNVEQLLMSKAIQDALTDIIVVEAQAGSGKTLVALSNAMRLMDIHKDKYNSIVYMRNSVDDYGEKDEEIGFLSGNDEKLAVYLGPIKDSLDFIARDRLKSGKLKGVELEDEIAKSIDVLRTKYNIQEMIALGTRGRTFADSILIIDEAQNIGHATMQKLISRVGKNCKVIVVGSNKQIDSQYLTKWNNGLSVLLNYCKNPSFQTELGIFAINLQKTVRSEVAKFAEQLFAK